MEKQSSEIIKDFMSNISFVDSEDIFKVETEDYSATQYSRELKHTCEICEKEYISFPIELDFKKIKPNSKYLSLRFTTRCEMCHAKKELQIKEYAETVIFQTKINGCKNKRIEPEYYNSSLETFIAKSDSQKKALEEARKMVSSKKGKIVLTGMNGTGKTHLGVSVLKEIGGKIYTMYEISAIIRASYKPNAEKTELEIVDELAWEKCLVIDEIGRTKGSETEKNWLSYIIDKRHVRDLPTFIISNNHMRNQCPNNGCDKCLENYFDNDLLSRFSQDSKVINMDGEDYRRSGKVRR